MRKNRQNEILEYFTRKYPKSVTIKELSEQFGISDRMVRNYITSINDTAKTELLKKASTSEYILKDHYRDFLPLFNIVQYSPASRISTILAKLLSGKEINAFDLADELFVDRSTLDADLVKVRRIISPFALSLKNANDELSIEGSEQSKRKLTSYLISNDKYDSFNLSKNQFLSTNYQSNYIRQRLEKIFDECHFIYNDYSLNNIVLHIIITVDRLKHNNQLMDVLPANLATDIEWKAADEIIAFLHKEYNVDFSEKERQNMALFLSCNLATVDYNMLESDSISSYVSEEASALAKEILNRVEETYDIHGFDDIFFSRFSLHINNLLKRIQTGFAVHNPLRQEIIVSYPLVYDIAVFIAGIIDKRMNCVINEDEISLIALHIGGFLETAQKDKKKLTTLYIYADYHGFYKYNIEKLQKQLSDVLNIKYSISSADYVSSNLNADLIISEMPMEDPNVNQVSPFIKDSEIEAIQAKTKFYLEKKQQSQFQKSLKQMFQKNYFFKNISGSNKYETLHLLLGKLKDQELFSDTFEQEVIERENISSTCFHTGFAVPHAISQDVNRSFISICCYDKPIEWGNDSVRVIVIIGIAYHERRIFRDVFRELVDVLSSESSIIRLSHCNNWEEAFTQITGDCSQ